MLSPEVTAAAIAAAGLYALYRLVRFATADADLAALGKRPPAAGSFEGKVVWLVGASQVRAVPPFRAPCQTSGDNSMCLAQKYYQ